MAEPRVTTIAGPVVKALIRQRLGMRMARLRPFQELWMGPGGPTQPGNAGFCGCCNCPCGGTTSCACACCTGDGFFSQYTFTIGGISDAGQGCLTNCPDEDGSWTLNRIGSCVWNTSTPVPAFCTGTGPYWSLSCNAGTWRLASHVDGPVYQGTGNCHSPLVLTNISLGGFCNYPGSVTLTPGGTWTSCGSGPPAPMAPVAQAFGWTPMF
jgi:hypothetical protein